MQHQFSARRKGMMEFTHISKSGGTSFCRLAVDNGCQSDTEWNCLVDAFGDDPSLLMRYEYLVLSASCSRARRSMSSRAAKSAGRTSSPYARSACVSGQTICTAINYYS
ncbi:hypothetical protein Vretifemale_16486 [Volvox reticuliferus]|uniref:Uncharacterized protein n=1 Tax=Volvox reticuliferus TaxID=1737510 RepID=A0A8J4CVJ7_9CHLO|nr:hypothetical protein Vretifemale_16486 [Volvox reticuliferus]